MAIAHLHVDHVSRKKGLGSAVAKAAYISGETLQDERLAKSWKLWEGREDLLHAEILLPEGAPEWMQGRGQLWNGVERAEQRMDSRVAWDMDAALPKELSDAQNIELVRGFVREHFTARGMVTDIGIHAKEGNPHVHLMVAPRAVDPSSTTGFSKAKDKSLNLKATLVGWRESWEKHVNAALEDAGRQERIDMRSYAAQGIEKRPTRHLGAKASDAEKKGIRTRTGDYNRAVRAINAMSDKARELAEQVGRAMSGSIGDATHVPMDNEHGKYPRPLTPAYSPAYSPQGTPQMGRSLGGEQTMSVMRRLAQRVAQFREALGRDEAPQQQSNAFNRFERPTDTRTLDERQKAMERDDLAR